MSNREVLWSGHFQIVTENSRFSIDGEIDEGSDTELDDAIKKSMEGVLCSYIQGIEKRLCLEAGMSEEQADVLMKAMPPSKTPPVPYKAKLQ